MKKTKLKKGNFRHDNVKLIGSLKNKIIDEV